MRGRGNRFGGALSLDQGIDLSLDPPVAGAPPDPAPTIVSLVASLSSGDNNQNAYVEADELCFFRFRWKIGNKGIWSAWGLWVPGALSISWSQVVSNEPPNAPNFWFVQAEAKDAAGQPATNNGIEDSVQFTF